MAISLPSSLTEEEKAALVRIAKRVGDVKEPVHFCIYGHGVVGDKDASVGDLLMLRKAADRFAGRDGLVISVRVLFAPPGSCAQKFHLDFAREFDDVETYWVAVTPSTEECATEVLQFDEADENTLLEKVRQEGSLPKSEWFPLVTGVEKLVLGRWECCKLRTSHKFHRRSKNCSRARTRVTFNVDIARGLLRREDGAFVRVGGPLSGRNSGGSGGDAKTVGDGRKQETGGARLKGGASAKGEKGVVSAPIEFVCVDTQRSLLTGRICGREVVDDLAEQDVFLEGDEASSLVMT